MIKKHASLWIVLLLYIVTIAALLAASLYFNRGDFTYALDDPYIHMSMAKNFAAHGLWAMNQMDFSSASSSPMWVLMVSGVYWIFGAGAAGPFVLNVLFQVLGIVAVYSILKKFGVTKYLLPFLLAFVFVTPLPAILFTGMEHSAQILFVLLFVYLGSKLIADETGKFEDWKYLVLITPVMTSLRYESVFLAITVSFLLALRGKKIHALMIFILSLLPVAVYGIISKSHGWYFLPNTLLLKSTPPGLSAAEIFRFCYRGLKNITEPHILAVLMISVSLFFFNFKRQQKLWTQKQVLLLIAALTAILNMGLVEYHQNGWFYRYDSYLMAMGVIAIAINLYDYIPGLMAMVRGKFNLITRLMLVLLIFAALSPLVLRAFTFIEVPYASNNIYEQHYQVQKFVVENYNGVSLGANDIGMIDFYSNCRILDLYGLANMEVAADKLGRRYNTAAIEELAKSSGVKLVIAYANGYGQYGGLPANWRIMGEWTMTKHNFVCGYETVTFYAINPADESYLRDKLTEFSARLPKSVTFKIY